MANDTKFRNRKFKSIGTRPPRPDGLDKVTGRAKYGADTFAPGQLVGLVLRSPHAHAEIKRIDTTKAEKLNGVKAVITSRDLPDLTDGDSDLYDILENSMARGRALYDGHAVAAVAAIDAPTARKALKLISVTYKILPHVTDVDEAMKPDAPLVQPRVFTSGVSPKPKSPSNVAKVSEFGHGDVKAGFKAADVIVERSYKTEQTHQGYIEPHACLASVGPDGHGELWVTTQGHFIFRNTCAALLGMEVAKLKVTSSEIGGGFGGKTHIWMEPIALALSRKANRPVKVEMSRDEVFRSTGPTASTSIDIKIGAKKDGRITAATAVLRYQDGAFPGSWAMLGAMTSYACYDLKNVKTTGYDVLVNRPKVAAYRAPSAPMAAFAVESAVDELATEIGMDPIDFRIKNAAKEGTQSSYGPTYGPIGIGPTLAAAKKHPHMRARLGKNQGRGMACGFWFNFGGETCTDLNIGVGMPLAGGNFGFTTDTEDHSINLSKAQDLWIFDNMLVGLDINDGVGDTDKMAFNADFYSNNGTLMHAVGFAYGDADGGEATLNMTTSFGVESAWTDWATVRLGYSHGYDLMNQAGAGGDDALALGLGFNYGSFNLDMGINKETQQETTQ